jgi:hypothetical protein
MVRFGRWPVLIFCVCCGFGVLNGAGLCYRCWDVSNACAEFASVLWHISTRNSASIHGSLHLTGTLPGASHYQPQTRKSDGFVRIPVPCEPATSLSQITAHHNKLSFNTSTFLPKIIRKSHRIGQHQSHAEVSTSFCKTRLVEELKMRSSS